MPAIVPVYTRPSVFTRPIVYTRPSVYTRPLVYGFVSEVNAFQAAGVALGETPLSNQILGALNEFVIRMKRRGMWTQYDTIYPIVGGTTVWHSLNLKNPSLYRMIQNGVVTNNANGTQGGVNGYWDTTYDVGLNQPNGGFLSVYSRTNVDDAGYDLGFDSTNTGLQILNGATGICYYNSGTGFAAVSNSLGLLTLGCNVSAAFGIFQNGLTLGGDSTSLPQAANGGSIYFMANNNSGTADGFSTRQYSFLAMGNFFDDQRESDLYLSVQTLQSGLGRQV